MKYQVTQNNIHIEDSAFISKRNFGVALTTIYIESEKENNHSLVWNRSWSSLELEWAVHNFLYMIGYKRERTKDVDLDYPQKWWMTLAYNILGSLCWVFIR